MIDWSKLKTYKNNKYRSFEELCYQIAKGLYGDKGNFISIDDSGGGDGEEFHLTMKNGDHWGWQAKFYYPDGRLSVSNRKQPIKKSLKKACKVHPQLKKWILCTPSDFTVEEQKWFKNTLPQDIPEGMKVELEHWGDSDFNNWLSEPRFSGKYHYFFGELELDINWFQRQFDKQIAAIGGKFNPSLHTETSADTCIHALLGDEEFVKQIEKWVVKLNKEVSNMSERISDIKNMHRREIKWAKEDKLKVVEAAELLQKQLVETISVFERGGKLLQEKILSETKAIDWQYVRKQLDKEVENYSDTADKYGISKIKYIGEEKKREWVLRGVRDIIDSPASLLRTLLDTFFPDILYMCKLVGQSELIVLGDAGMGKTHTTCNICDTRLKDGLPSLFVRGKNFANAPIGGQLLSILDIPMSYSWNSFLQALSAAAESYRTHIPLVIDGLNEPNSKVSFSSVRQPEMRGFVEEIKRAKNIALVTTHRAHYAKVAELDKQINVLLVDGFNENDIDKAISKHFNRYKISASFTESALEQLKRPIYLKFFCEINRDNHNENECLYVGLQVIFDVFEEYLKQCNTAVCNRINRHPEASILQPALQKIANYLWTNRRQDIPLSELTTIIDNKFIEELDWQFSKTHAIEAEGVLDYKFMSQDSKSLCFSSDLLCCYLIAKYLIEESKGNIRSLLYQKETIKKLFSNDYSVMHPLHKEIGKCLAVITLNNEQLQNEILESKVICNIFIDGLFEMSANAIDEGYIDLVAKLFKYRDRRDELLALAGSTIVHVDHPFNASFWSKQLEELPIVERDISWTEYVRENSNYLEKDIENFEKLCKGDQELSDISKKRLHLMAEYTMWMLTSTVRKVRDKATRALYWYGRRLPKKLLDLVLQSLSINDPYVSERMLAASYGVAMARQYDFKDNSFVKDTLPLYGRELYENMFKPNAKHSTTHILARDYARRTIDTALLHHSDLLTNEEKHRISPPFKDGGIRDWCESENIDDVDHKNKTAILGLDFENYTIGRIVKDRAPYEFEHEEYKLVRANILGRVHDLGYSHEVFKKIDDWIGHENNRHEMHAGERKMDRYGKKYAWIAYYEVAGFREDNGLLRESYADAPRILDIDIDPSFPDDQYGEDIIKQVGDQSICNKFWTSKSNSLNLIPYLLVDKLCSEKGTWGLLSGYISQKDEQSGSEMFAVIMGVIVKRSDANEIVKILRNMSIGDWSLRSRPRDYLTYAGEIPWCDTYKENSWEEFSVEEPKHLIFKFMSPVRESDWQSDCTPILDSRSAFTPSKQIAKMFDMCGQPQNFDFFQKNGRRASITVECKEEGEATQKFTYLRKDLLGRYLKKIKGELIWLVFGQRTLKNGDIFVEDIKIVTTYGCIKKKLRNSSQT